MLKRRRYQAFPHVFWCSIKIGMCVWANTSQQNSLHGRWYWCWETTNPFRGLPSPFSIVLAQLPEISFPRSYFRGNTRNQPKKKNGLTASWTRLFSILFCATFLRISIVFNFIIHQSSFDTFSYIWPKK